MSEQRKLPITDTICGHLLLLTFTLVLCSVLWVVHVLTMWKVIVCTRQKNGDKFSYMNHLVRAACAKRGKEYSPICVWYYVALQNEYEVMSCVWCYTLNRKEDSVRGNGVWPVSSFLMMPREPPRVHFCPISTPDPQFWTVPLLGK